MDKRWDIDVRPGEPAIRASFAKEALLSLEEDPQWATIEPALDPVALSQLRAAPRSGWLPIGFDVELCRAAATVMNAQQLRAMGFRNTERTSRTPLLGPVAQAAGRLLNLNPKTGIRFMKRSIGLLYRDCGVVDYVDDDTTPKLVWHDIPAPIRTPEFLHMIAGGFAFLFPFLALEGEVSIHNLSGPDSVEFHFRWEKPQSMRD